MANEEFLKFEITDQDIENEFTQHRTRRFTKEQQIYGMWADEEDDSEDDSRSNQRYSTKKKKNYSGPVAFVSGGVHQPSKKPKEEDWIEEIEPETDNSVIISDSSDEEVLRPSFSVKSKPQKPAKETEMAGFRKQHTTSTNTGFTKHDVGNWEKHTKGIGAKLLLKMGYQPGKGLGKELQGIDAPIEAHLRKGKGCIGFHGPETKQKKMSTRESVAIEEPKSAKSEKSDRSSLWRKTPEEKNKIRYSYKTIDEVIEESKKPGKRKLEISELSKVKVIDMTGPEQRILSGYHAIAGVQKPVEEWETKKDRKYTNFSMPELQHNLNLLVDVSREAIVENDQKLRYSEDRVKLLQEQRISLHKTIKQEKTSISNMRKVIDILESVIPNSTSEPLTLEKADQIFSSLKENHYAEFCAYEVPVLAVNVVRPLFNQLLSSWKPLEDPTKLIPEFVKWRSILLIDDYEGQTLNPYNRNANPHKLNPYFKLVWDTWVPCVRNAVNLWNCRDPQPMVDLIKNWIPLMSEWILDNIVRETIFKKIQMNVEEWNPMTDNVPIQSWVFPWIPLLSKSFETTVYPVIKKKIGAALDAWHPQDTSAILMLQPWMGVLDPGEMEAFLVKNIVPKLRAILDEYIINPNQQSLDTWHHTMGWAPMIQPHTMAALLDRHFFPRWLQTLSVWLNMNPDFDQVSKWFSGWKNIIPEKIREQPIVKGHLRSALEMMSKAVGGNTGAVPPPQMHPPQFRNMEEPVQVVRSAEVPTSLKALVQSRCEENGIIWHPVPNRYMEAKQVFRCGKLLVYFDRTVLFVSQGGGSFTPMSWQEMLENAV